MRTKQNGFHIVFGSSKLRAVLCLLCCLLLFPFPSARSAGENAAPGIRVRLRRLALTDRADLRLEGSWLLQGKNGAELFFASGSQLVIQLRENQLVLHFHGLSTALGTSATLKRQENGDTDLSHGLRFTPEGNLYPGDLKLQITDGQLDPILTIALEDYLLGVIPYEMSERFPLEALKAQAVCARTYALSRKNAKRSYDVVDTTSDQVFRGVDDANVRCAQAIRETTGQVITWKGRLAEGWYSASNGGQTELPAHVWGGSTAAGCYALTDDPYDLENPESLTRKVTLQKDGSNLYAAFLALIRQKVLAEPEMKGFWPGADAFRVDSIDAVTLTTPRFAEPSRLMTEMQLTVTVSARKPLSDEDHEDLLFADLAEAAETKTPEPVVFTPDQVPAETPSPGSTAMPDEEAAIDTVSAAAKNAPAAEVTDTPAPTPLLGAFEAAGTYTVTLSLFPDVIAALGLSISGAGNEMISVKETDTAFQLTSARFGHGVGLSQRGAQQMAAKYDKTWQEIIAFYFPGSDIREEASVIPTLPAAPALLAETPGPAATPTPRPTLMPVSEEALPEGAWLASVENIEDDSSLNLRAEPSAAGEILMRLMKHQQLVVLEDDQVPGWAHVKTDAVEGYVMVSFLEKIN